MSFTPRIQTLIDEAADYDAFVARVKEAPYNLQVRTNDELPLAIVRQNKKTSNMEEPLVRECRSVVVAKSPLRIVCWSPPKSDTLPEEVGADEWEGTKQTEFVDGTMVNAFFQEGDLWIATRSFLHATCRFQSSRTFAEMFQEAMTAMNLNLLGLPHDLCMTFILTHPENRIVKNHTRPGLVLVSAAELKDAGGLVHTLDVDEVRRLYKMTCWVPRTQNFMNPQKVREFCEQPNLSPAFQGVMVTTADGRRWKQRNPTQDQVRRLRGNNRRADQRFLQLLQDDRVMEQLQQYREERDELWALRQKIQDVWRGVFAAQKSVFMHHVKRVADVEQQYRPVIVDIHKVQLEELRPAGRRVDFGFIRSYITALPIPKQLFIMNQDERDAPDAAPVAAPAL